MTMRPRILMCPPDYYGIEYEINPWMDRRQGSDRRLALAQWEDLRGFLEQAGAKIDCMQPVAGMPDLVFTANAAMIYGKVAIPARFRHQQRQVEESHAQAWLAEQGWELRNLKPDTYFEGAGDALFCGDTLLAGYRIRTAIGGHQQVGDLLGCRVISLELINPRYYHLDTCFCPLAAGVAIYYPPAFDDYGQRALREVVEDLIPVVEAEAWNFACNAVVVGRTVITNAGCPQLHRELEARGYEAIATPLSEFVKSGGSAKCLTLRLDGEEAASWKYALRPQLTGD
jgi:N-dimethylarginine dimethylaminohydrolase